MHNVIMAGVAIVLLGTASAFAQTAATPAPAKPVTGVYQDVAATEMTGHRMNHLIEMVEAGEFGIGPFSAVRDQLNARTLAASKLDFIVIDMEHNAFDAETLRNFIWNMRSTDGSFPVAPIVRIPINGREAGQNQWLFKQILDAGAMGIMVPQVNSVEDAQAAVVAMRYPPFKDDAAPEPRGQRGFGGAPAAWGLPAPDYAKAADLYPLDPEGELLLIVQIETAQAVDDLEEIMAVPGVGAAFLGPADLHADMGYPGSFAGVEEVEAKIQEAGATAERIGAYLGILGNASDWEARRDQGYKFVMASDQGLSSGLVNDLKAMGR
ncbi:HpcH/HpaI aldolase family protein [Devosia rhizoryzae]|uniref:HpcH/HpaI aldolase/citrate lyase domain-containing protein n=1 Tax=Devosia rhizoryzae TaxID=2774137 RepID=A0ABX7C362_9HYPH|nr:aldolase/citrate lyase family protein [Devosia rhizoryzae]QQR38526.1 hypothetical protein JI748_12175 [Devosia rhizoryzae]